MAKLSVIYRQDIPSVVEARDRHGCQIHGKEKARQSDDRPAFGPA